MTKHPHFTSGKGGHDVTGQVVWGGQYVTSDKLSASKLGWTKNTWMDSIGVNVTGAHCHSRRFIGWTDSVGRIVAWSVCRWTDRLGTDTLYPLKWSAFSIILSSI